MTTDTSIILARVGITNSNVNYSQQANAFLSDGFTSAAGNTYFSALRFTEGIVVRENVGQGYLHTFLNGLKIFSIKDNTLLCDKTFDRTIYDKSFICNQIELMLMEVIVNAATRDGLYFDKIKAAEEIKKMAYKAVWENQMQVASQQSSYLLTK